MGVDGVEFPKREEEDVNMDTWSQQTLQAGETETPPGVSSSFDLSLDSYLTDVSILESFEEKVYPSFNISGSDHSTPCEFVLPASSYYTDLSSISLVVIGKLTNAAGGTLTDADKSVPVSNFLHGLWTDLEISLNGVNLTSSSSNYNYISYLLRLFSTSKDAKETKFASELFFPDSAANTFSDSNSGYKARREISKLSSTFQMVGALEHGIFKCKKMLRPNISMRIKLKRALPESYLESSAVASPKKFDCFFNIESAHLVVKRCNANTDVVAAHQAILNKGYRLKYSYIDSSLIHYTINSGTVSHKSEPICQGPLPLALVVACIKSTNYYGNYTKSGYCFSHENISKIRVTVDGNDIDEIDVDIARKEYMTAYTASFDGLSEDIQSHGISVDQFLATSFSFVINLLPSNRYNKYQLKKSGTVRLEISFKTAPTENLTVLCLLQDTKCMSIDRNNQIYVN